MEVERVADLAVDVADAALEHPVDVLLVVTRGASGVRGLGVGGLVAHRFSRVVVAGRLLGAVDLLLGVTRGLVLSRVLGLGRVALVLGSGRRGAIEVHPGIHRHVLVRDGLGRGHLGDGLRRSWGAPFFGSGGFGEVGGEQQRPCLRGADLALGGELGRHRLEAATDDAGEAAHGPLGDREVGEAVDVQVQDAGNLLALLSLGGSVGFGRVQGADQRECGQIDPNRDQARLLDRPQEPLDHVALCCHQHDLLAGAGWGVDDAQRLKVEDRVVERHRHLLLGLEVDCRREFLGVGDRWQLERPQHGPLVGDADAHPLRKAALVEQLPQRLGEAPLVVHFAVTEGIGGQGHRGCLVDHHRAVAAPLGGGDEARLDVEPHDRAATAAEAEVHQV